MNPRHERLREAASAALIAMLTIAAYLPALRGEFLRDWDDGLYVTENQALHDWAGLRRIWLAPGELAMQYYPLTLTSLWLDRRLFGDDPRGYHAVNVVLHAGTSILFYILLKRLGAPLALVGGLVFALHPMHVESVAWIAQRKNVLSGLWSMLALGCWAWFLSAGGRRAYAGALGCFAAAIASKSAALPLPAVMAALAWGMGKVSPRNLTALAPFFLAALAMGLVNVAVERGHGIDGGFGRDFTPLESCLIAGPAWWFYLGKFLLPVNLAAIYPMWSLSAGDVWQIGCTAAAIMLLALLWVMRGRLGPAPVAAAASYSVLILPVLGFIDFGFLGHAYVADHFFYLPSVPIVFIIVWLIGGIRPRTGAALMSARIGGAIVIGALFVLTWLQSGVYRDAETFWRHNAAIHPTHTAYQNLAEIAWKRGDARQTILLASKSIEQQDNARSRFRLGTVYDQLGRYDEAVTQFELAIERNRLRERLPMIERNAYFNLGSIYYHKFGEIGRAAECWEAALRIDPEFQEAAHRLKKLQSVNAPLMRRNVEDKAVNP